MKRVSQAEIARRLGIHQTAVSAVLLNKKNITVRPEMRKKILREVNRLGYRPSAQARLLRGGKSRLIGVLHFGGHFQIANARLMELIKAIHNLDYRVVVHDLYWFEDAGATACEALLDARAEGVIISGFSDHFDSSNLERLRKMRVPVTSAMGLRLPGIPFYNFDQEKAFFQITCHLLEKKCSSLAFLGHWPSAKRELISDWENSGPIHGIYRALKKKGLGRNNVAIHLLETPKVGKYNFLANGKESIRRLLEAGKLPDGLICYNDLWAVGACAALSSAGISVPDQVLVTGLSNEDVGQYTKPSITTVGFPMEELAIRAIENLTGRIEKPSRKESDSQIMIPPEELIVRESTSR